MILDSFSLFHHSGQAQGGAFAQSGGTAQFSDTTFVNNKAIGGGGVSD